MQLNARRLHLGSAEKYLTKAANEQVRLSSSKGEHARTTRVSEDIIVEDRTDLRRFQNFVYRFTKCSLWTLAVLPLWTPPIKTLSTIPKVRQCAFTREHILTGFPSWVVAVYMTQSGSSPIAKPCRNQNLLSPKPQRLGAQELPDKNPIRNLLYILRSLQPPRVPLKESMKTPLTITSHSR
jgi:hypothetical protein